MTNTALKTFLKQKILLQDVLDQNNNEAAELTKQIDSIKKAINYSSYVQQKHNLDSIILLDPAVYFKKIDKGSLGERNNKKQAFSLLF
ncbi:hypothetical protein N9Y48_02115 [Zobellia sp.]|nr:hypothetical protein [Zobellia sp.]